MTDAQQCNGNDGNDGGGAGVVGWYAVEEGWHPIVEHTMVYMASDGRTRKWRRAGSR